MATRTFFPPEYWTAVHYTWGEVARPVAIQGVNLISRFLMLGGIVGDSFAYPELERAVCMLLYPDGSTADEALDAALRILRGPVLTGAIPRLLVLQRLAQALSPHPRPEALATIEERLRLTRDAVRPPAPPLASEAPPGTPPSRLPVTGWAAVTNTQPKHGLVTWSQLATRLTTFQVFPDKAAAPLWSPCRMRPGSRRRSAAAVEAMSCIVLDFDAGSHWSEVLPHWAGVAGVVHTSWSHTPQHPKWRLVMPLRRLVPAANWRRVWEWAAERSVVEVDGKCKDTSRAYFVPAVRSEDWPRESFILEGEPARVPSEVLVPPRQVEDPWQGHGRRVRAARAREGGAHRGELYKTDEAARRELGVRLGGRIVAGGTQVKGVQCPACGRASLAWWVVLGKQLQARCNHRESCGHSCWLDELEGVA